VPTLRRCALLCVILGAHLLLFSLISVNDNPRSERRSEEAPGILFFVELPKPNDTQPSTHSSSERSISTYVPSLNTITLPPEIEGTDALIDWDAEASRVAKDAARRLGEEKELRSLDQHPAGMGPLPPKVKGAVGAWSACVNARRSSAGDWKPVPGSAAGTPFGRGSPSNPARSPSWMCRERSTPSRRDRR
jgi:hypothetical protein